MISRGRVVSGYTLIELLIVMSVISLVLSIVGPMTVSAIDRATEKSELQETKLWLKNLGNRAFLLGTEILVEVERDKISIYNDVSKTSMLDSKAFKKLEFEPTLVRVNSQGFASPNSISFRYLGNESHFQLND
ncbi:prepilin-type N-terminal cleavage/methylation domain-containing protein [Pseudoalteromonas sp. BMB]|nr:prepilin-type N-terminal cleavage/methylation domain-containing protein [Pseudoalteromonas sp. BMB]